MPRPSCRQKRRTSVSVSRKTEALVRYAETLVLPGGAYISRIAPRGSRAESRYRRFADGLYRRFLCPLLTLVVGCWPFVRGYYLWACVLLVLYFGSGALLAVSDEPPWEEISRSNWFNFGLLFLSLVFLLFPLPSIRSDFGVKSGDVRTMCELFPKLEIHTRTELEYVRDCIEIREQRMEERIKALKWGSAALWLFFVFFLQGYFRSVIDASLAGIEGYSSLLPWLGTVALVWLVLVQSYATTIERILKTVRFALIDQMAENHSAEESAK